MAVEYLTKEEVMDLLAGLRQEWVVARSKEGVAAIDKVAEQINKLYTVRPVLTGTWKVVGDRREFIYCGRCGFKTLSYKRTAFCPNCGRRMLNGRVIDDKG